MYEILCLILVVVSIIFIVKYLGAEKKINNLKSENKKILSSKKSSEVRTGLIAEQIAPFLTVFQHDPSKATFIGKPIDFIVFDEEGIFFVEVKSGGSRLSKKQRKIRNLVQDKKVKWEVVRIEGKKEDSD